MFRALGASLNARHSIVSDLNLTFSLQFQDVRKRKSRLSEMNLKASDRASAEERRQLMKALKKRVDNKITQAENYRACE
jgi:hypothetical protein